MPKVPMLSSRSPSKTLVSRRFAAALPIAIILGASGCVNAPPIIAASSACSTLIPDSWRKPVEGAPLPEGDTIGDWVVFGDAQTGRLDVANGRQADTLGIIERCETRDQQAVKRSRPKFLGLF